MRRAYFVVTDETFQKFKRELAFVKIPKHKKAIYNVITDIKNRPLFRGGRLVRPREMAYMRLILPEKDIEIISYAVTVFNELCEANENEKALIEEKYKEDLRKVAEFIGKKEG